MFPGGRYYSLRRTFHPSTAPEEMRDCKFKKIEKIAREISILLKLQGFLFQYASPNEIKITTQSPDFFRIVYFFSPAYLILDKWLTLHYKSDNQPSKLLYIRSSAVGNTSPSMITFPCKRQSVFYIASDLG